MDESLRIAAWRRAKGLTQQALATEVGVSVSAVSYWESGSPITLANLHKVTTVLGVSMARFYGPLPKRTKAA